MSMGKKNRQRRCILGLAIVVYSLGFAVRFATASTADGKVRAGLRHFDQEEFEAAGQAFAEADVAEPENPTIAFDRACALAATGDLEKARDLLRQVALSRDVELAARSHYNLGTLSAAEGKTILGDDPVAAAPQQRQAGLTALLAAVAHYRDCLQLVADHSNARHNLELIRLFIKHIESQWETRDKQQAREEMNLLEFLAMIQERQGELRSAVQGLKQQVDSPQRRQALQETSASQGALQEEIAPLQTKIAAQFQQAQQAQVGSGSAAAGSSAAPQPAVATQSEQALQLLTELASGAGRMMMEATSAISAGEFDEARSKQREVLDQLNQIFMAVAPFAKVLERAIQQQEQLTDTSAALVAAAQPSAVNDADFADAAESDAMATAAATSDPPVAPVDGPKPKRPDAELPDAELPEPEMPEPEIPEPDSTAAELPEPEWPELEWRQSRISDWSRLLSLKAESELPSVEAQLEAASGATTGVDQSPAGPPDPDQENSDGTSSDAPAEDPSAQLEALQESLKKAVELAPQVEQLSAAAAAQLDKSDPAAALPDQQQAQELLREIAKPLAGRDQQQQQQGDQSGDQQNQQNEQDQGQNQQQNSEQPNQQTPDEAHQQQASRSPQERAMSTLRRARQREQQHRDLTKQLQQMTGGRAQVDRDW